MHYEKDIEGRREKLVIFHMKLNVGGGREEMIYIFYHKCQY